MNITVKFAYFAIFVALSFAAPAQNFPERPINLVVAYSAGGSTDVVMRVLADIAAKHLGQRVIVENRAGAGGTLGPLWMSNQKPDGYTIAVTANSAVAPGPTSTAMSSTVPANGANVSVSLRVRSAIVTSTLADAIWASIRARSAGTSNAAACSARSSALRPDRKSVV